MRRIALCIIVMMSASLPTTALAQISTYQTGGRTAVEQVVLCAYDEDGHCRVPEGYTFHQWPGVYFETRFKGRTLYLSFGDYTNRFRLYVDDDPPVLIDLGGGEWNRMIEHKVRKDGWHTARLEKISESQDTSSVFYGFFTANGVFDPPPARTRQIEFIGDSDMVGYAATSTKRDCTNEEVAATTDTSLSFPVLAAKHFDADYQINAYSGIGVVRNYDGTRPDRTLPRLYPRALFDDPQPVYRAGWNPQVIVIGLGGNDFSTALKPDETWPDKAALRADWVTAYVAFVRGLRAQNPKAHIVMALYHNPDPDYIAAHEAAFAALSAEDPRIARLQFPATENTACHYHMSPADYRLLAQTLIGHMESQSDIWSRP